MLMNKILLKDLANKFESSDYNLLKVTLHDPVINEVVVDDVEIVQYGYFLDRIRFVHGLKSFLYFNDDVYTDVNRFIDLWIQYKNNASNIQSWQMLYSAYFSKYNPIDNYDKNSHIETSYEGNEFTEYIGSEDTSISKSGSDDLTKVGKEKETITKVGKETVKTKETGKEFNEKTGTEHRYKLGEEQNYNVPFENNEYAPEGKTKWSNDYEEKTTYGETNNPVKDTKSFSNDRETTVTTEYPYQEGVDPPKAQRKDETLIEYLKDENGNDRADKRSYSDSESVSKSFSDDRKDKKSFEDRKDIVNERTHGNVGTTMTSDIISKEFEMRKKNLADMIIDNFINQYCTIIY